MTAERYGEAYTSGFDRTVRLLVSRGAQQEAAREAAQAAWVRGWERLEQLRDDEMVVNWVNTIAMNVYRQSVRRQTVSVPLSDLPGGTAIDVVKLDLERVFRVCRPAERVLLEKQRNGVSAREIARQEGVTETAIRIRLLRARRAAHSRLEQRAAERRWTWVRSSLRFKLCA
jgi:DNA-directed RNA polymerase specialized sigma24 family protein